MAVYEGECMHLAVLDQLGTLNNFKTNYRMTYVSIRVMSTQNTGVRAYNNMLNEQ